MRTALFVALLLSLHLPAAAQLDPVPARSRVSITAFSGVRVPYGTGYVTLVDPDGTPLFSVTERRGGNALLGLDAEVRVAGPIHVLIGGIYSRTGISEFYREREAGFRDTADFRVRFDDETLFARLGASARFGTPLQAGEARRGPATDLFAAAGLVRQLNTSHPAVNAGFKGAFPVGRDGLEFVVGLEDFLVFWNQDALAPVFSDLLRPADDPVGVQILYDTSHVLLLRAGLTLRF